MCTARSRIRQSSTALRPTAPRPGIKTQTRFLDAEVLRILKDEARLKRFHELGMDATPISQDALAARIRSEAARYKDVIEKTGVKLN